LSAPDAHPPGEPHLSFVVAGVGASAGGLEAYSELLEALPENPGLALLLVSHLDPGQKSHLPEILGRVSKLPVAEVAEGMRVEVDRVYVIPPGTNMAMVDGHLTLTPRPPRPAQHMPIDHLFRSLADIQRDRAAAVVLSGNGTDGAIALQAVKAAGGVTFAQDETTAKYPSMPRAAVLEGGVDHVLRPREIARELGRIARHPYTRSAAGSPADAPPPPAGDPAAEIVGLVRTRTGVDFANYKQTTIRRRVFRRMALRNLQDPRDYLAALRADAAEVQALYQDLLIRVTQFFRDPEAFAALREKVFPALTASRPPGAPVRVWVAGCSTGEEVYSLAISLLEFLDGEAGAVPVKVLATDLNEAALEKARAGVYLDNIEIDVSPERLRRFFVRHDGHYQISKAVREVCVFSRHNLATDPPFSRIDLVSCRNVLIYLDTPLQKRVMPLLHYALNPGGFLFLGSSENVGPTGDLFEVVDARHRVFARTHARPGVPVEFSAPAGGAGAARPPLLEPAGPLWSALDVQKEADRVLLARYAPVGVVVDEGMTVLQFRGRTAPYLEPAPGMATLDLFRMLREGLLAEVRTATAQAKAENAPVVREGLRVAEGGEVRTVRVEVVPFKVPPNGVRFFLVLFQDAAAGRPAHPPAAPPPPAATTDQQVAQLQQEIGALREYLQSVIEEQESTNEELKSANEEILSSNEELQSTNEELQTAKEEAQSANEELATLNEELRHRNAELARANNDLVNLLSGVNIPIVMVGRDLRVRRFTPLAEKTFNLIPSDVGRPIGDIKPNIQVADLSALIAGAVDTLVPYEGEVRDAAGRWYSLRIRPYVTLDNKIDGASVVLLDIDSIRRSSERPANAGGG
jgi:two-component system CheB/CheR fusion protein